MTDTVPEFDSLSALLRQGLGDLLSPDAETLLDIMTEDIVFEFPFALADGIERLEGKQALAAYLPKVGELFTIEALVLHRAILSKDGQHAVLEFAGKAYANASGHRYDQTYISVLDLRDGLISRYRDYWNPLIVMTAADGGKAANATLLRDE